jgi:hypothetical protein
MLEVVRKRKGNRMMCDLHGERRATQQITTDLLRAQRSRGKPRGSRGEAVFDREFLPSRLSWVGKPSGFFVV